MHFVYLSFHTSLRKSFLFVPVWVAASLLKSDVSFLGMIEESGVAFRERDVC